jgi:hypothetical protein
VFKTLSAAQKVKLILCSPFDFAILNSKLLHTPRTPARRIGKTAVFLSLALFAELLIHLRKEG